MNWQLIAVRGFTRVKAYHFCARTHAKLPLAWPIYAASKIRTRGMGPAIISPNSYANC